MYKKEEKKVELSTLKDKRLQYERLPSVKAYLAFQYMNPAQKMIVEKEWEEYYAEVAKSWAYERFIGQRDAFKKHDLQTVKDLARDAHQQLESQEWMVKKPTSPEPASLSQRQRVLEYRRICWEIYAEEQRIKNGDSGELLDF